MTNYKYNLSIVSIMKYEEDYVEEWVRYHHILGVDHFYIYDNNEDSYMRQVLKQYIEKDIVTLIPAYGEAKMFESFNHAIENYKYDSKYIAFIDADEFIMPIEDVKIFPLIDNIIASYNDPNIGGLAIRWQLYGTGYHETKPDGYVMENYLYKTMKSGFNHRIKSIVNPRMVEAYNSPHYPTYKSSEYYSIDEHGNRVDGAIYVGSTDLIRINHYYYKSEEEFTINRLKRGKCDRIISETALKGHIQCQIDRMKNSNQEYDDIMLRYIDRMKMYTI